MKFVFFSRFDIGRPNSVGLIWAVVCAGVCLLGCAPDVQEKAEAPVEAPEPVLPPKLIEFCGQRFGEETAKVHVTGVLPASVGCQDPLGLYLIDVARQYPAMLTVEVFDMKSDDAAAAMMAVGVRCACVIVNGKTRFDLGPDGGKILLEGPMDPADAKKVVQYELRNAYGEKAPALPPAPEDTHTRREAAGTARRPLNEAPGARTAPE